MEWWNGGIMGKPPALKSVQPQYSNIPLFQYSIFFRHGMPNNHWSLCSLNGSPCTNPLSSSPMAWSEVFHSVQYFRDRSGIAIYPEQHGAGAKRKRDPVVRKLASREFALPFFEIV
jgi:hypothetical protein